MSTQSSFADRIEAGYKADGHCTWGFVIYRTTYDNDADWDEFMRRLRIWTAAEMDMFNGQDVLDHMTWTIFDDRETFDNADTSTIRTHFRERCESALRSEQCPLAPMGRSPRYRYCVQVDGDALKSSVHYAPPPLKFDHDKQGWVKVIKKDWLPRSEDPIFAGRKPDPEVYEPIEGCTERHVGWMRWSSSSAMTEYYMLFQDLNQYVISYRRPPKVIGYPWK